MRLVCRRCSVAAAGRAATIAILIDGGAGTFATRYHHPGIEYTACRILLELFLGHRGLHPADGGRCAAGEQHQPNRRRDSDRREHLHRRPPRFATLLPASTYTPSRAFGTIRPSSYAERTSCATGRQR